MRRATRQFPNSGFTLIELLIVMVIITLLVGAVAPKFAAFTAGRKAVDAATQIVSMARFARSQAISEGQIYRFNVDPNVPAVWLSTDKGGTFTDATADLAQRIQLPAGVSLETDIPSHPDGGMYVTFRPTGRSEPASITLTDQNGKRVTVMCASATELFHIAQAGEKEIPNMTSTEIPGTGGAR